MLKKLYVKITIILLCILIFIIALYLPVFITYYFQGMRTFDDEGQYYKAIKTAIKGEKEINLAEIFTFEWEKMYIVPDPTFSGTELAERIGVDCNILPIEPQDRVIRIIFYNDNEIVYDYLFDTIYLEFQPLDQIINRESAVFTVEERWRPIILKVNG